MNNRHATLLLALLLAPIAAAQYTTGFEPPPFVLGDVNGQDGWGHLDNSPTGGAIEPVPAGSPVMFGTQSLAIRTRNDTNFGVQNRLYSATIDPAAGETGSTFGGAATAVDPRSHFAATLWFRTPDVAPPDGRFAELNPSSKASAPGQVANRYAQVRVFSAGTARVEIGWYRSSGFTVSTVANLAWGQWYRFEYAIELIDGTAGAEPNDRFTLTIFDVSGVQLGTACGSTWELPWRSGSFGGTATPRAINGFDLWSTRGPNGFVAGHLDNVTFSAFDAAPLAASIAGDASACAGGTTSLTANVTGGFAPFTYVWRNAANDVVGTAATLDAGTGTYTLTATDALCVSSTSAPFVVSETAALAVSIGGTSPIPMGGTTTLTANVTGGSGTIASYAWRDAAANLVGTSATFDAPVGTYTVTVTDAACGTATSAPFIISAAIVPGVPTASELALAIFVILITTAAVIRLR